MDAGLVQYQQVFAELMSIIRPAIVAAVLFGVWAALGRALPSSRNRLGTWLGVAIPLVVWFVGTWIAAAQGAFQIRTQAGLPLIPLAVILPVAVGLFALTRSRGITAAVDAAPPSWLIGVQVYRLIGANFVVLWLFGAMPGVFAVPAGFGDAFVGLMALPVAWYVASGRPGGRAAAVAWNFLGIADLVNALTLGFLSAPSPLQLLAFDHPNRLVGTYPTVMTPAFAVPLSLILHGLSLWQLRRRAVAGRAIEARTSASLVPAG
jgi:hypothetical protein